MSSPDSPHSPDITPSLSSVESLRFSLPQEHQSLFDTLRREVIDFCTLHSIPTSSLNNDEDLREATKHLPIPDLAHLSLVLKRLEYLVTHKEPMPEERVSLTQEQAREIMGNNFLGTREVEEHFGKLSPEQEEALSVIPFSEETLEECVQTHILVVDIGLSILDIRKQLEIHDELFNEQDWYNDMGFAKHGESARWRLIRKTPVKDSLDKTWNEQQAVLDQEIDEVPSARQFSYTIALHFLATGEQLFKRCYARTSDVDFDGDHVHVGGFSGDGIIINSWLDIHRETYIGLASARVTDF